MAFVRWVGAFHAPLSALTDDIHSHAARPEMHTISSDPCYINSVEQLVPIHLSSITEPTVFQRSCRNLHTWNMKGAYTNAERALFDSDGSFYNMKILLLWGDMTISLCSFAAAYAKKRCNDAVAKGTWRFAQEAKFVKIEGGNHFVSMSMLYFARILIQFIRSTFTNQKGCSNSFSIVSDERIPTWTEARRHSKVVTRCIIRLLVQWST